MSDDNEPVYTALVVGEISNGKGYWNHIRVGVFRGAEQVGEYTRNYGSLLSTFFPFEREGKWYALYSPDYTATRVMSLPDCKDIGGEESNAHGFCPAEFYVPELCGRVLDPNDPQPGVANHDADKWALRAPSPCGTYTRYYWPDDKDHPEPNEERKAAYLKAREESHKASKEWMDRNPYVTRHAPFGFVYGCPWGAPYWMRFIDLSRVNEGVLTIDDRFDCPDLPRGVNLKDAIDTESIDVLNAPLNEMRIRLAQPVAFDMTGKKLKDE